MKERIIQFGEGNFLRAFVDDFVDIMNKKGLYDGKAVIVKPTPRGNIEKFKKQNCVYHLILRGVKDRRPFCEIKEINSVSRCIDPYADCGSFFALARDRDLRFIVSNTTEAGIAFDESCRFTDRPALSFPGKLTQLLYERYKAGLGGFVLLACELIDKGGEKLRDCVLSYARLWELEEEFSAWIREKNVFCNTLVDRIVTGYPAAEVEELFEQIGREDELLDTAEPFHFWAIEGNFEDELPLKKAGVNVIWTDDISPVKKRKVRLLNGAHTSTVFPALLCEAETVEDCMKDGDISAFLRHFLSDCALKTLDGTEADLAFAKEVPERFKNPYLHHRLTSIALNSASKYAARVTPTALDLKEADGAFPKAAAFSLACLIYYYRHNEVSDDEKAVGLIRNGSLEEILASGLFGADLTGMLADVEYSYALAEEGKIREGLRWAIS